MRKIGWILTTSYKNSRFKYKNEMIKKAVLTAAFMDSLVILGSCTQKSPIARQASEHGVEMPLLSGWDGTPSLQLGWEEVALGGRRCDVIAWLAAIGPKL